MSFKVGDSVVHPAHGVGRVVRLEPKRFFGAETRLYYEVAMHNGTYWVPVEPSDANHLRALTAKSDLARYRALLRERPTSLNQDHRQRHLEVMGRLRQGAFRDMCEIVRDLTARSWRKPLREADTASLRRARERLCQEWAAAEDVTLAEATREVDALLLEARQVYG
jgi:CarD family transcriptional regulator